MNNKRILTLLVEIDEKDKPIWIWNCHLAGIPYHGVNVIAIAEGDQLKDIEDDEQELKKDD